MTKRKKTRKKSVKKSKATLKYKLVIAIFLSLMGLSAFFYFNYFNNSNHKHNKNLTTRKNPDSNKKMIKKMAEMLKKERKKIDVLKKEIEKLKKIAKEAKKSEDKKVEDEKTEDKNISYGSKKILSEAEDFKKSLTQKPSKFKQKKEKKIVVKSKKPMLCIIIDDVSTQRDADRIKRIPFKITPSIFPPTKRHPNTPKLAKEFDFYMIHLPLEAYGYPGGADFLKVGDGIDKIEKRIKDIKKWFPADRFINNHTGSKFTSDYESMYKLYKVLNKNGIVFLDSRTSIHTIVGEVARRFHEKLLSRNIFLDNKIDKNYIRGQLKKAIAYAKKHGYAIAIGHPHKTTLDTLRKSSHLLKDVKTVYVSEIYEKSRYFTK